MVLRKRTPTELGNLFAMNFVIVLELLLCSTLPVFGMGLLSGMDPRNDTLVMNQIENFDLQELTDQLVETYERELELPKATLAKNVVDDLEGELRELVVEPGKGENVLAERSFDDASGSEGKPYHA